MSAKVPTREAGLPGKGTQPSAQPGGRPAVSYLVRFWLEPREQNGEVAPSRGYVRDLKSGQELYFDDPRKLAEHILRRLHAARQERDDASGGGELANAAG